MRRAIFKAVPLPGKVDGKATATMVIEQGKGGDGVVIVRPARGRREYSWPLGSIAEAVCWKAAKFDAGVIPHGRQVRERKGARS